MDFLSSIFRTSNFCFDKIPSLSGKVCIVTGGNTGIGKVTCRELAKHGAHVILTARSRSRGQAAVDDIKKLVPEAHLELMELDLSNLQSVTLLVRTESERVLKHLYVCLGGQFHK
jgi:NAD(P)-dependent dehydrogenase (short-subunit alcohol dehydrogenase family)